MHSWLVWFWFCVIYAWVGISLFYCAIFVQGGSNGESDLWGEGVLECESGLKSIQLRDIDKNLQLRIE